MNSAITLSLVTVSDDIFNFKYFAIGEALVLVAECCLLSLLKKFWIGRRPLTGRRELHRSSVAGSGRKYEAEKVSDYMGGQGRPGEGGRERDEEEHQSFSLSLPLPPSLFGEKKVDVRLGR